MLDLCDDLQRLRGRIADPSIGREERTRLRRQTQRRIDRLERQLASFRGRGPLARLLRRHRLDAHEFEVLAVLLQRAVRAEAPELEGRLILGSIFDTSFGVLSGLHLLHEDARLRRSGLVRVADDRDQGSDVLETRFRLSELALQALREEVAGRRTARPRARALDGYRSQRELLLDLWQLHNHYARRRDVVFAPDRLDDLDRPRATATSLSRRIDRMWSQVRTRLMRSPPARDFPAVQLLRKHGLGDAETVIVVHLLFQEICDGNAFADVADLLRLVSGDEGDLLRARRFVHKDAPLLRGGILVLEPFVENRELTAEARLNDWVVAELLDEPNAGREIQAEERLRWHEYLNGLADSQGFFRDLDA